MTSSLRDPMASHYSWMFTSRRIEVPYAAMILVHGGGWSAGSKRANFIFRFRNLHNRRASEELVDRDAGMKRLFTSFIEATV